MISKENFSEAGKCQPNGEMESSKEAAEKSFNEGLCFLRQNKAQEAMLYFKNALRIKPTVPRYSSYYGLCWAMVTKNAIEPLQLCKKAVEKEMFSAQLLCNLGRVYLLRGDKKKAYMTFQKGLLLSAQNKEIKDELKKMGFRRSPVIFFLARENPINKLLGQVLKKISLR